MKAIVISEGAFEKCFRETLAQLELDHLREQFRSVGVDEALDSLHRKFHYEVCRLKAELEKWQ